MENNKEIKGWSWLGFFFMPYYYAGYGKLKIGLWAAVSLGFFGTLFSELMLFDNILFLIGFVIFFLAGFTVVMYGGMYAKEDLPVKQEKFSWLNVFYACLAYFVGVLMVFMMLLWDVSGTPKCNDTQTKELVKQISLGEFKKLGMSEMSFKLSNIRTSAYHKEIDKYECAAELTILNGMGIELSLSPISYTSQMTEDSGNFYVEVFGL